MRFNRKASVYHEKADIQKISADWCSEWIERDCGGLRAIELGAGTGLFTRHLALRGFDSLLATDKSKQMLEEGRKRLPMVEWAELDAWGCETASIDRIYASSLLQWAHDPVSVLKNWRNALELKGRVLVCLYIEGSLEEFVKELPDFSALQWRSELEWLGFFREAGFDVSRSESRDDVISYASSREALRAIHDLGAIEERRMSPGELKRFLNDCDRRFENRFGLSWKTLKIECVNR
jgi:SAM-dependent methyltransferase